RRERLYRGNRPLPDMRGKTVILVDDGLATGASMQAAVKALRQHQASRIVVGVPVAAPETCDALKGEVAILFARSHPSRSMRLADGMRISRRPPIRKSASCLSEHANRLPRMARKFC